MVQFFIFISTLIVCLSLLTPYDFCVILNVIYSLSLPVCILPLYLYIPSVVIRSELNSMMTDRVKSYGHGHGQGQGHGRDHGANNHNNWKWKLRFLYSTRSKFLIIAIASILQLIIYFVVQYTLTINGDCQLYSIYPFILIQCFYLLPIIIFTIKLRSTNDPHLIRLEILTTIIVIIPAIVSLFLFISDRLPFPFQYAYIYAAITIFICNLVFPLTINAIKQYKEVNLSLSYNNINTIFDNDSQYESFVNHCVNNMVTEYILFYQEAEQYKLFQTYDRAYHIYNEFIKRNSPMELNLDDQIVKKVKDNLEQAGHDLFDDVIKAVDVLLRQEVIPKWKQRQESVRTL